MSRTHLKLAERKCWHILRGYGLSSREIRDRMSEIALTRSDWSNASDLELLDLIIREHKQTLSTFHNSRFSRFHYS